MSSLGFRPRQDIAPRHLDTADTAPFGRQPMERLVRGLEISAQATGPKVFSDARRGPEHPCTIVYDVDLSATCRLGTTRLRGYCKVMAKLEILTFPDPRLRRQAEAVQQVDDSIRRLVDDMFETMYEAPGIGLAAIQVNVAKRVVVIDTSETKDQPLCLINPEILSKTGEEQMDEGCLSVPGFFESVSRAECIRARALDRDGQAFEFDADGLLAVCVQHEIDHLDGRLFVDHISALKRQRIRKKLEKERRQTTAEPAARRRAI